MGYGLPERRDERCIVRARFLASKGNILFVDWGLPLECHPLATREETLNSPVLYLLNREALNLIKEMKTFRQIEPFNYSQRELGQ